MCGIFVPGRVGRWFVAALVALLAAVPATAGQLQLASQADPPLPVPRGELGHGAVASADGRYVAFVSDSNHQVPGQADVNGWFDVFLYDRVTGSTTLVSRSSLSPTRAASDGTSWSVSISADGRYVAYDSTARDVVAGQVDAPAFTFTHDVFLFDRVSGTTTLVSRASGTAATASNGNSYSPAVSADGSHVAFTSTGTDLIPGQSDAGTTADVFLYERATGTVTLVSHAAGSPATAGNGDCDLNAGPALSADGRYAVYRCTATDLVVGQTDSNGAFDYFLFDRTTGNNVLVSRSGAGAAIAGNDGSETLPASLSADGRWVVFASDATDLVAGQVDTAGTNDVFLFDRDSGTTTLLSRTSDTATVTSAGAVGRGVISADGHFVAFASPGANLIAGQTDANGDNDVFLLDRAAGTTVLVSHAAGSAAAATWFSEAPAISGDGAYISFLSFATDLVSGQSESQLNWDCFLYERATGAVSLVSRDPGSATTAAAGPTPFCHVVADGSRVVVESDAPLVATPADPGATLDVFLYDRAAGTNAAVSLLPPALSATANGRSEPWSLSADGRWLAFSSSATNLISGLTDANSEGDLFLYDRVTGNRKLVSHAAGSATTTGDDASYLPMISADGRYIAFESDAGDLVPPGGPSTFWTQIYLHDRVSGTTTRMSPTASLSTQATISGDGRYVAWASLSSGWNVYLRDRAASTTELVSHAAGSTSVANAASDHPKLSTDGRYLTFKSQATNLVPGQVDVNGSSSPYGNVMGLDLFLFDTVAKTTVLVSRSSASATTTANSHVDFSNSISADGRFVAFASPATDLAAGQIDGNGDQDIFLFDRQTGTNTLVSHAAGSPATAANAGSTNPLLSADGRYLVYSSLATNLVAGTTDSNGFWDTFLYDRVTGTTSLISHAAGAPGTAANGYSFGGAISADGRRILFRSMGNDLIPGQEDSPATGIYTGTLDLFLQDRVTGDRILVSGVGGSPTMAGGYTFGFLLSADGTTVAFPSQAPDLVPGDLNGEMDTFVFTTTPPGSYFTLTPCRLIDTRQAQHGPALASGISEAWTLHGFCGIPATARAVAVNVTVTQPTGTGHLTLWSGDGGAPLASTLNFSAGQTRANNAILPLSATGSGALAIRATVTGGGTVHVLVDVVGYFE